MKITAEDAATFSRVSKSLCLKIQEICGISNGYKIHGCGKCSAILCNLISLDRRFNYEEIESEVIRILNIPEDDEPITLKAEVATRSDEACKRLNDDLADTRQADKAVTE